MVGPGPCSGPDEAMGYCNCGCVGEPPVRKGDSSLWVCWQRCEGLLVMDAVDAVCCWERRHISHSCIDHKPDHAKQKPWSDLQGRD